MNLEESRMESKFRPVYRELKALDRKIFKQKGFFFVTHSYSISELLNSEHHHKIHSYTEKIGDDINQWYKQGKLSELEERIYLLKRQMVEDELEELNIKIETREPTFWENVQGAMEEFVDVIMTNMPKVLRRMMLPSFQGMINLLGNFLNPKTKLLR